MFVVRRHFHSLLRGGRGSHQPIVNLLVKYSTQSGDDKKPTMEAHVVPKFKTKLHLDETVKSVKYITPVRSLKEYILSAKDLESLPRYYSRSPYSNEVKTTVFLRSDVEQLAFEKHGGKDAFLHKRKIMRDMEKKARSSYFNFNKALRYLRGNVGLASDINITPSPSVFNSGAGRVVAVAIAINSLNVAAKGFAWWTTGSKSMFSEMLHSVADTFNQLILAFGLYTASQKPDESHPYGYVSMRNVSSLISGVGIFFLGGGFTFYHGLHGLLSPHAIDSFSMAYTVMLGSFLSEGTTLLMAIKHIRQDAKEKGYESVKSYVLSGAADPSVSVVLLEDAAAVLGVMVASAAMGASHLLGQSWPDALGAIGVSGILSGVAYFIIKTNTSMLIGQAISSEKQEEIMRVIDNAKIIRGSYDVKATMMSGDMVRFKAEVDIDGRELTRRYLETLPLDGLLAEMKNINDEYQAIHFMLKHGDNLVNTLGAEINLIEEKIKKEFPNVKHIDIEIN